MSPLETIARKLRQLPKQVTLRVAQDAAPALTTIALQTFNAHEDAYGNPWKPGKHGNQITLHRSGDLEASIRYVPIQTSTGAALRVELGVPYAKYLIGKYPVFPFPRYNLPDAYLEKLTALTQEAINAS